MEPIGQGTSAELRHDFEISQYIQALGSSSSRVRFVMLAIIITSIASVATWWSERDGAWERARLLRLDNNYALASQCKFWDNRDFYENLCKDRHPALTPPKEYHDNEKTCSLICGAVRSLNHYGISSSKQFAEAFAQKQSEAFVNNVLYIKTPVLGITFDINNLGLISGLTFFILMLVMVFYVHRAHENLALCMWKVRQIAESDNCFDRPGSRANLLYHALAMQQVFTVPPTLARWRDIKTFRRAHYILFVLPLLVQYLVLKNDYSTRTLGSSFNSHETDVSLWGQRLFFLLVLPFTIACCAHIHADDLLWEKTFYIINPAHRYKGKARWLQWIKLLDSSAPSWGILASDKELFFCDSVFGSIWNLPIDPLEGKKGGGSKKKSSRYHTFLDKRIDAFKLEKLSRDRLKRCNSTKSKGLYMGTDGKVHQYYLGSEGDCIDVDWDDEEQLFSRDGWERLPFFDNVLGEIQLFGKQRLETPLVDGKRLLEVGGAEAQIDGEGTSAGFDTIRGILAFNDALFVTDGAWVRKIDSKGSVETWGGRPLGKLIRRERPFVLGLDVEKKTQSGTLVGVSPRQPTLLVCDFSRQQVLRVSGVNTKPEIVYESKRGWSPSGVFTQGNFIYLLEYRQAFRRSEIASFIQRKRIPVLVWLFWWRSYLRIVKIEDLKSNEGTTVIRISPATARRAILNNSKGR